MNNNIEKLKKMEDRKNKMEKKTQKEGVSHAPNDVNSRSHDKADRFLNIPDADAICEELPFN
jgi:hypothetical protein